VLVYFSAHWCPPCQRFTPLLAQAYQEYKSSGKTDLEIVFCSSDRDQQSFQGYYNSMPWVAMQFNAMEKSSLSPRFNVRGIPHIGVFGPSGQILAQNGRDLLAQVHERGARNGLLAECMAIWHPNSVAAPVPAAKPAAPPQPSAPKVDTSHWPSGVEIDNDSCTKMLDCIAEVDWEVQEAFYSTAMLLLRNILDKPSEPKFRSIKTDNAKIKSKVLDVADGSGKELFLLGGFAEEAALLQHPTGAEGKVRTLYEKISAAANCAKEKQLRAERDKKIAEAVQICSSRV
jgi:thiol-disulfide isomerase/thioredoxin